MNKILLTIALITIFPSIIQAQNSGDFDLTFGNGGKVINNIAIATFDVQAQAIQTDGKIVVVGLCKTDRFDTAKGFIVRTNADGTLDTTFSDDGKVQYEGLPQLSAVEIQSDGKIVVGGDYGSLFRFNADGTNDVSFADSNIDGISRIAADIAIQADNKILAIYRKLDNNLGSGDVEIIRYNINGTLDTTFNTTGSSVTNFGFDEDPRSVIVLSDGKILISGDYYQSSTNNKFFYIRYNANGSYDTTLNSTGKVAYGYTSVTYIQSFGTIVQSDGKMISAGVLTFGTNGDAIYAARINTNGTFDTTFSNNAGTYTANIPTCAMYNHNGRVKMRSDGKFIISDIEDTNNDGKLNIVLHSVNANGTTDTTFGTSGAVTLDFFGNDDTIADFNFSGNTIYLSGNTLETFKKNNIVLAKLTTTGALDPTFSADGTAMINITDRKANDTAKCIVRQSDGKILVGGASFFALQDYFSVVRYNTDGTIDTTFGENGKAIINAPGHVNSIAIDASGRIVVTGGDYVIAVARLTNNGTIDTSFGTNGIYDFGSLSFAAEANSVAIQANGKIIVAGSLPDFNNGDSNYMLARFNSNGTLDSSFGSSGISTLGSVTSQSETYNDVKVQTDGKIVAAGSLYNGQDYDMVVGRYNSNGSLDTTFNGNGLSTYSSAGGDYYDGMALQADGKILITGAVNDEDGGIGVIRFTTTGALDTTFGNNGFATNIISAAPSAGVSIIVMDNQKIVVTGSIGGEDINLAVTRFNNDGTIDTTFGNNGSFTSQIADPGYEFPIGSFIFGNNIYVGSSVYNDVSDLSAGDFGVAKYYLDSQLSTGTSAIEATNAFYPNPAINNITFDEKIVSAEVYDIRGRRMNLVISESNMNVANLPSGTYLLKLTTENGDVINTKLLKQ
ncbi:MAG: T9SS type A sorting domain-containing protein [Flavobacterium sp.]|nr:T9SS type A sorting domain-containing protein [Flavobacterium sp.]